MTKKEVYYCRFLFLFLATPRHTGILVSQPGIEPTLPTMEVWSLNHWISREFPVKFL